MANRKEIFGMRYSIHGEAEKFHKQILKLLSNNFNKNSIAEEPAHITIKYSFETDNIDNIEKELKKLEVKNAVVNLGRYGCFSYPRHNRFVIYMKVRPNIKAKRLQKKVIQIIKNNGVNIQDRDRIWKPHNTIYIAKTKEEKVRILKELKKLKKEYELNIDSISITKKKNGRHSEYRTLKLLI